MNKNFKLLAFTVLVAFTITGSGCSLLFKKKTEAPAPKKIETPDTNPQEDIKVQEFLQSYFGALYADPVDKYYQNILTGNIPTNIAGFIEKRTIDEGNNNPEVGIHFPRMVEINGMTIVGYEVVKADDGKLQVDASFLGKKEDTFMYFVKVNLRGKALHNSVFNTYYQKNPDTKLYDPVNGQVANEQEYDYMKVQAKYDVEVVKDGEGYKIRTQREANLKPGFKKRIEKLNNEFMDKLPYLDMSKAEEKAAYDSEAAVIRALFDNLLMLDKERMTLLKPKWDKDYADFMDFVSKIGINKSNGKEIIFTDASYKTKFGYDSLPLQVNMDRIVSYDSFEVAVHPAYSQNNKYYFVKLNASVIKANGIIDNKESYVYDYLVTLRKDADTMKVDSIRLSEYYKSTAPPVQNDQAEDAKKTDTGGNTATNNGSDGIK